MNIIGDVAGRFKELQLLMAKMPKDDYIFVGDLNDRGTETPEVIQWVMDNAKCVQSNHGDMFVDYVEKTNLYQQGIFTWNGGTKTLNSYLGVSTLPVHIEWLKNLPYYYEEEGLLVTHAALDPDQTLESASKRGAGMRAPASLLWNRGLPEEIKGKIQIFGHNSHWGLRYFGGIIKPWAICIDQSGDGILTGIHYPSLEVFTQEYLPEYTQPIHAPIEGVKNDTNL